MDMAGQGHRRNSDQKALYQKRHQIQEKFDLPVDLVALVHRQELHSKKNTNFLYTNLEHTNNIYIP
jgi:hypothetical protein